jgi:hypothetical protein
MSRRALMRTCVGVGVAVLLTVCVLFFGISWCWEIDVQSGRLRSQTLVYRLVVHETRTETRASILADQYGLSSTPPDWHTERAWSPFARSPRYMLGGARQALEVVDEKLATLPESERRDLVLRVLESLKLGQIPRFRTATTQFLAN